MIIDTQTQHTVAFHTLGCKLNFAETSTLARLFSDQGYRRVKFEEKADVYVINTCSVTSIADKKSRYMINKAIKTSPSALIAVVGCYSQLKPEEIEKIEGVNIILGSNDKFKIIESIELYKQSRKRQVHSCEPTSNKDFVASYSSGDRTRSFLKIQDGCDYVCTYCTIPLARGKSRNSSIDEVITNAREIAAKGFKEIVLTGVNIGDFGRTTGNNFFELLKQLEHVEGIERYRISSIEPNLITDEIISYVKESPKFLPHFHIPLQAGSNKVLALMKRRYNREIFADRIHSIKKMIPTAFIGIDVIVGFPGETEDDFMDSYQLLNELEVSFLHIFPYSERPNTPAIHLPGKVKDFEITNRSQRLHNLSEKLHKQFYLNNLGLSTSVLFEHQNHQGKIFGFTNNYIKVEYPFSENLINRIENVKLIDIAESGNVLIEIIK